MNKKRFRLHLNIGTLIFGIIFVYLIITLIMFASRRHIETYQVVKGPLSGNDTHRAIIVRNEEAALSGAEGYVTFFLNRTSKVAMSQDICFVGESKTLQDSAANDQESLDSLRRSASAAARSFDPDSFDDIYDFQYSISGLFLNSADIDQSQGALVKSSSDGIVSLYTDGYESFDETMLTADLGQNAGYLESRLKNGSHVKNGTPLYRIINSEEWYVYFYVSDEQTLDLSGRDSVNVKFLKDDNIEKAGISFVSNNNERFCKLTFNNGLIRYADDRFVDIELVNNSQTGLKIPASSIVEKQFYIVPEEYLTYSDDNGDTGFLILKEDNDGSASKEFREATVYAKEPADDLGEHFIYYVDMTNFSEGDILVSPFSEQRYIMKETGFLKGVYSTNKGYGVFRTINILDENADFAIVSEGTPYGISLYDYIVKDGSSIKEEEILY